MKFIRIVWLLAWCLGFFSLSKGWAEEIKGLWVVKDALYSPAGITRMITSAVENGFNTILVQVRARGDSYYRSNVVPKGEAIGGAPGEFDPLYLVVEQGHRAGLQVHAWINLYIVWSSPRPPGSKDHIFYQHPDWFVTADSVQNVFASEDIEGIYLSPALPGVRQHLLEVVREIVDKYEVDGIHLDYVRYPGIRLDYNLAARTCFMQEYGVDPLSITRSSGRINKFFGTTGIADLSRKWSQWRAEQVTALVRSIHELITQRHEGMKLSAAVKPDIYEAYYRYGQDWVRWANEGIIDFVIPMAYSNDTKLVVRQIRRALEAVGPERLYAGIGTYNQPLSETIKQIGLIRTLGTKGFFLFSYNSLQEDRESFERLRQHLSDGDPAD